jgi:hypothetical protein
MGLLMLGAMQQAAQWARQSMRLTGDQSALINASCLARRVA